MTQPFGPPTPSQSGAQPPTEGPLTPRVPLSPSAAPVAAIPSTQQLTTDPRVANGVQADAFRDGATILEQMSRYFGDAQDSAAKIAQNLKDAADHVERSARSTAQHASRTHSAASSATPYHPDAPQPHGEGSGIHGEPTGARAPFSPSAASTGDVIHHTATMPEGRVEAEGFSQLQGMQQARWNNLADARMSAARYINRRVSEVGASKEFTSNAEGTRFRDDRTGHFISSEEAASRQRSLNRIGQATGALTKISSGEATVTGALAEMVPYAGVIGGAFAAAHFVQGQMISQRAQNQFYQQISGGSNFSGFAERGREFMNTHSLSAMFGMGSGQASELYRGVSQMGITGDQRTAALNFATDEFYKRGMDIQSSLQLISESVRNGVTDFGSLRAALDETSKAAQRGGLNVSEVNKQLAQNYQMVQSQITGTATATIAGGLTSTMAAQGQTMQGINLAQGLTSETSMRTMAAQQGMSYGAFMAQSRTNPSAFGRAAQGLLEQRTEILLPTNVRMQLQRQANRLAAQNGTGTLSSGQIGELADQLLASNQVDPAQIQQVMAAVTGGQMTQGQAAEFLVRTATGGLNVGRDIAAHAQAATVHADKTLDPHNAALNRTVNNTAAGAWSQRDVNMKAVWQSMGFKEGPGGTASWLPGDLPAAHKGGSQVDMAAYQDFMSRTGERVPEIEALLKNPDRNRKFTVQTKDGPKQVNTDEAIKYYSDQLAAGTATISAGSGQGHSVADVTGMSDPNVKSSDLGMKGPSSLNKASPNAKTPDKGSAGAGSVAIYPMPALLDVLKFVPSGGAYIADNRNSGTTNPAFPPDGNVNNLPSSTGPGAG